MAAENKEDSKLEAEVVLDTMGDDSKMDMQSEKKSMDIDPEETVSEQQERPHCESKEFCEYDCGLDCCQSIPRINATMLPKFVNQRVVIVGKVMNFDETDPQTIHFQSADGAPYVVHVPDGSFIGYGDHDYVQVMGKALTDSMIEQHEYCGFGKKFNMTLWKKFVDLNQQFPNIF